MLNTAAAAGNLQKNFKKIFDNADKEVDLAVNHFVRAAGNAVRKQETDEFRKKIGDSFTDPKKLLIKIKQAKKVSLAKYAPEEMVEIEANMPPDEIDESTKTGCLNSSGPKKQLKKCGGQC